MAKRAVGINKKAQSGNVESAAWKSIKKKKKKKKKSSSLKFKISLRESKILFIPFSPGTICLNVTSGAAIPPHLYTHMPQPNAMSPFAL